MRNSEKGNIGRFSGKGLPHPFNYYRFVLRGDHLHFGLWPRQNPNLSFEEAQEYMFNHLLSYFPEPPATVLDVGCGLGLSAALLSQKGYTVTAIAPSHELINYAKQTYGNTGVEFRVLGFLDEGDSVFSEGRYDVLLFQESTQYISPLNSVLKKARWLLKEKGIIIIGDEVCYDASIKSETAVHMSRDFIVGLSENGFKITDHKKIGRNVMPTCDFMVEAFTKNLEDLLNLFSEEIDSTGSPQFYLDGWKKQKRWYSNNQIGYEVFVAKKDNFFIGPYKSGDEHEILPMFNRIFGVNRSIEHWYWKFRDNPYGSYKISTALADNNRIVVHYAGYPVPFYSSINGNESFVSFQIGDTMTSPEVRNIGLGKTGLLARTARYYYAKFCEGVVPFIYGFNTGKIRKLGMRYLDYTYIDPVVFRVKNIIKDPIRPLSFIKRHLSGFHIEEVSFVNEEWDEFFNRVSHSYSLLVKRDASYIKWRYLDCPDRVHRVFAVRKRGSLIGWGVFRPSGENLIWGDALFDRRYPDSVTFLLYNVLKDSYEGIKRVEGWFAPHPDWWNSILDRLGFQIFPEPDDLWPGFSIFADMKWKDWLKNHFYYTKGDSDLF